MPAAVAPAPRRGNPTAQTGPHKARRSQAQRRSETRTALLDATATCLTERGYAATTTPAIVAGAGLSQGALFKHFPTKADLLAATAEHLYGVLLDRWLTRFATLPDDLPRASLVDASIALLWEMYQAPELAAAVELTVAARTDADLRARLDVVSRRHADRLRTVAAEIFPSVAVDPAAEATVDVILEALVGLAISQGAGHDPDHERRVLRQLTALAHAHLPGATEP